MDPRLEGRKEDMKATPNSDTKRRKSTLPLSALGSGQLQVSLLREQVLALLRQAIIELRLKPGDLLVERELIEWTGVSRATIREALRQLTAEGLVKTIPQKGTIVAAPSPSEAKELYEIRAMLEGLAVKQFTERATEKDRKELRAALHRLERLTASGADVRALLQAKNQFYSILLRGAYNKTLHSLLSLLQARIAVLRATSMSHPGRPAESVREIRAVVESIERDDADAAQQACVYHIQQAARYALEELGVDAPASERERKRRKGSG